MRKRPLDGNGVVHSPLTHAEACKVLVAVISIVLICNRACSNDNQYYLGIIIRSCDYARGGEHFPVMVILLALMGISYNGKLDWINTVLDNIKDLRAENQDSEPCITSIMDINFEEDVTSNNTAIEVNGGIVKINGSKRKRDEIYKRLYKVLHGYVSAIPLEKLNGKNPVHSLRDNTAENGAKYIIDTLKLNTNHVISIFNAFLTHDYNGQKVPKRHLDVFCSPALIPREIYMPVPLSRERGSISSQVSAPNSFPFQPPARTPMSPPLDLDKIATPKFTEYQEEPIENQVVDEFLASTFLDVWVFSFVMQFQIFKFVISTIVLVITLTIPWSLSWIHRNDFYPIFRQRVILYNSDCFNNILKAMDMRGYRRNCKFDMGSGLVMTALGEFDIGKEIRIKGRNGIVAKLKMKQEIDNSYNTAAPRPFKTDEIPSLPSISTSFVPRVSNSGSCLRRVPHSDKTDKVLRPTAITAPAPLVGQDLIDACKKNQSAGFRCCND